MKKFIALFLVCSIATIMQAQTVINDPNAQVRQVGSFTQIKVSHAIDLYLTQSSEEAVAVSGRTEEYRDNIRTSVENGVLRIWYDDDNKVWKNAPNKKLRAYVSFKTLNKLIASGASDVRIDGTINVENLEVHLSGASDMKGSINAQSLVFEISGASDATISGKANTLKVDANGASDFKGYEMQVDHCTVDASGASDINITVNKELNAKASGASGVHYKGSGVIRDVKTSGASSISKRG